MHFVYLAAILISIAGLIVLDWRYRLAFWYDARRTALVLGSGVALFLIWDILGISLGVFFHGGSQLTLPLRLLPELPLEEVFFLLLLCYTTLLVYLGAERRWPRT